ncbi:DENN-domain-containing protein [Microthyrium microscopicum]|uniref:DENN-domain-containing protein n=1 Tax=Microthyrium microscopicum TaxID=703497 RepID=A0A6A6UPM8_9PEZI|nr:DENN-domain-containing protein [Microthyrium microscopicum]
MAPIVNKEQEAPLADYFFIAGIESSQVFDEKSLSNGISSPAATTVEATIEENEVLETETNTRPKSADGPVNGDSGTPKRNSKINHETRRSVSSLLGSESLTASNRSSATIKGGQVQGTGLNEVDFDNALRKFAAERESFLEEIHFNAGAPPEKSKRKKSKAQRIMSGEEPTNALKSSVGSLRRKLSTMNSLKRQPSVLRQASIRTSKRLSGYNSVIPVPQPLQSDPNMHPLKRRYEPVLLDRYPPKNMVDDLKRRVNFPDYVPMFAFPNDVTVISSDERPRSTWHGFAMTNGDGSRLYGICVIMWVPLNEKASEELERQCEEWRKKNMSNEERELAASLGERLALERAKLSRLLAKLPAIPDGSEEREILQEEINMVEEKITLMTDLLRPVRHGAASRIDGLTDGGTGLWIPRAFGILGRDGGLTSFWKEWLKAVVVPMTNGQVLRVPASSPRIGMWQPLERYVVNLCAEAPSPINSATQVEIAIRELRLYARKEGLNEIPGCRNVDLYALFRSLSIPNIVTLLEYVLNESRIILLSSHTSMLHLVSHTLIALIYPLKWSAVFIPVLPSRLIQALEAPCPYIVGVERRYENLVLPDDDYVLVDLDENVIEATALPVALPRQQRRKLIALLQHAAQHHTRYGVDVGPPEYAKETYPHSVFSSENPSVFSSRPISTQLPTLVGLNSAAFGTLTPLAASRPSVFNAFAQVKAQNSRGSDQQRPTTSSTTGRRASPPSPRLSPVSAQFSSPTTPINGPFHSSSTPVSRSDSGFSLQATLREKRSGHFDTSSRRSSSFGFDRMPTSRRPSQPFLQHTHTPSTSTLNSEWRAASTYAPSVYAQSTLAASTVMPGLPVQPVMNAAVKQCVEGHLLQFTREDDERSVCAICDEGNLETDQMVYCTGCTLVCHLRCSPDITVVCPHVFRPDQIRAAFVRTFASLLYTYRRFLCFADPGQRKNGLLYSFNADGFLRSIPHECQTFMDMLLKTQAFNEFIHERELQKEKEPSVRLFDQIILAKKNRGKRSTLLFSKVATDFLSDTSNHLWRTAATTPPSARFPGDYRQVISRVPAKLDTTLMKEPRVIQGVPRMPRGDLKQRRKPVLSGLGLAI